MLDVALGRQPPAVHVHRRDAAHLLAALAVLPDEVLAHPHADGPRAIAHVLKGVVP